MAVALWDAFRRGDIAAAKRLQQDLIATWEMFRLGNIWGAFDEALRYLGLADRATGSPYVSKLSGNEKAKVRSIIDQYVKPYLCTAVTS